LLKPNWEGIDDPIDRIFALLNGYRIQLITTDCTYGCPIGNIALEIHEPDPKVRELLAANFANWSNAVERCLDSAADRLPRNTDRSALAEYILTVMEGAVMQARTYRELGYFDRNIAVLREHIGMLEAKAKAEKRHVES
jgi:TetR/AcrR family transcriptional regulator, transcriptional repressor for nem operon